MLAPLSSDIRQHHSAPHSQERTQGREQGRLRASGLLALAARSTHTRNAEILGEAFWDIHAPSRNASAVLSEVDALRREARN
jgi:hypothetical protein